VYFVINDSKYTFTIQRFLFPTFLGPKKNILFFFLEFFASLLTSSSWCRGGQDRHTGSVGMPDDKIEVERFGQEKGQL